MAIDHQELYASTSRQPKGGLLHRTFANLAVQDILVLGYLLMLNLVVLRAPDGPARTTQMQHMAALLVFLVATLFAVRGELLKHRFFAPLSYRLAIYGTVQLSYFLLRDLLPLANTGSLDDELFALGYGLFGFEPAVAMDAIVNPVTTEWFAFFYFLYFFILALHVIPILMFSTRTQLLAEFALGMLLVFCVGHTVYMLVPGYGPYREFAGHFQNALPSDHWVDMVMAAVASGGAQKDIFPSLHTAAPTFIAMFSFRHRDKVPFKYTWMPLSFVAVNIIIATMFLRWHYVIDVVAGLLLSVTALIVSVRTVRWELVHRAERGLNRIWPRFFEDGVRRVSRPSLKPRGAKA